MSFFQLVFIIVEKHLRKVIRKRMGNFTHAFQLG